MRSTDRRCTEREERERGVREDMISAIVKSIAGIGNAMNQPSNFSDVFRIVMKSIRDLTRANKRDCGFDVSLVN